MSAKFTIVRDNDRYPNMAGSMPHRIECYGSLDQAKRLAEYLTHNWPGCDDLFYVLEDDPGRRQ